MRKFVDRHYIALAAAVLGLAAFNLTFRLGREFVAEWDESLYAISAWEALTNGSWIGTTFLGQLDYYNTKPPLLVWLAALSFKVAGPGLASMRFVPAMSAWLTIAALQYWTKQCFGRVTALLASLVLATTFGFIHVHAGRSLATDAPFALVMVLMAVTLWAEPRRPWMRAWLGPLLATAFLLRGMAVLMPLVMVAIVLVARGRGQKANAAPTLAALALFLVPVGAWVIARHQVDGWRFFEGLFLYDFVARTVEPLEDHPGGPLYYLNILQKHQYDWLLAAAISLLLLAPRWERVRAGLTNWRDRDGVNVILVAWAGVALLIPTLMRTKVPWYLNTFYPAFAVGVGWVLSRGFSASTAALVPRWRVIAHASVFVLMLVVAEGKLLWYSFYYRDVRMSVQSLLLAERDRLRNQRLFLEQGRRATYFVATAIVGAAATRSPDRGSVLRDSRPGDYVLTADSCQVPEFETLRSDLGYSLCRRR